MTFMHTKIERELPEEVLAWLKEEAAEQEERYQQIVQAMKDLDTSRDQWYEEFFERLKKESMLEPAGLQRQLDALQKSIDNAGGSSASRDRSLRDLATLRKQLRDDQFDEFRETRDRHWHQVISLEAEAWF